jgi:hypothetical protein
MKWTGAALLAKKEAWLGVDAVDGGRQSLFYLTQVSEAGEAML